MRAIILCAGMGTRLAPFTTNIHKAFLPIDGKPIIERTLNYLHSKDITDTTLVVGHLAEQFEYLADKFGVGLRYSTLYKTHNNYTSMQLVLDKMEDCIVMDGDFYIVDDFVAKIDTTKNQYFGQRITHGTEWGMDVDSNNRLLKVANGYTEGWGILGLSYWKGDLTPMLTEELQKSDTQDYWDQSIYRSLNKWEVYANLLEKDAILEFDKIEDLLFHNLISHQEIAELISEIPVQKVNDSHFEIVFEGQKQTLNFSKNTVTILKENTDD